MNIKVYIKFALFVVVMGIDKRIVEKFRPWMLVKKQGRKSVTW